MVINKRLRPTGKVDKSQQIQVLEKMKKILKKVYLGHKKPPGFRVRKIYTDGEAIIDVFYNIIRKPDGYYGQKV